MINAFYEPFPETVTADGREYPIITDFREWFRFADMLEDKELSKKEKLLLMAGWLLEKPDRITSELVDGLCGFYRAKKLEPDKPEDIDNEENEPVAAPPVISWKIDAGCIIGDFMRFYRIDLLAAEMHWWRFRLLFSALPDDSQIMKRIAYRSIDPGMIKSDTERKRILRLKQLYALPFELDDEDIGSVFLNS